MWKLLISLVVATKLRIIKSSLIKIRRNPRLALRPLILTPVNSPSRLNKELTLTKSLVAYRLKDSKGALGNQSPVHYNPKLL